MIAAGLTAALALVDLCIKDTIEQMDGKEFPRELEGTKGRIILHKFHNDGFPMGFLRKYQEAVKLVPLVVTSALGGVLGFLIPQKGYVVEKTALVFTIGGALSNLYDRMKRGYVVDYFSINCKGLKKIIFNLGDIFIFVGSGILLLNEIFKGKKKQGY